MRTWVVGIAALLGSSSLGQERQTIRLAVPAGYIEASVLDEGTTAAANEPELEYHWFRAQQLQVTVGGAAGRLLDGPYQAFHPDGQLLEAGTFKKGVKNGVWRTWRNNGDLASVVDWKNGRLHGDSTGYAHGSVVRQTIYRRGAFRKLLVPKPVKSPSKPTKKDKKKEVVPGTKPEKTKKEPAPKGKRAKKPKIGGKGAKEAPSEAPSKP